MPENAQNAAEKPSLSLDIASLTEALHRANTAIEQDPDLWLEAVRAHARDRVLDSVAAPEDLLRIHASYQGGDSLILYIEPGPLLYEVIARAAMERSAADS